VVDNPPVIGMADNLDTITAINTAKNAVKTSSATVTSCPTIPTSIVQPMVSEPEPVIEVKTAQKSNVTFREYATARKASLKDQLAAEKNEVSTIHLGVSSLKATFPDPPLPPIQPVIVMMARNVSSDGAASSDDTALSDNDAVDMIVVNNDTPAVDMIVVQEEQPSPLIVYIDLELDQFPIPVTFEVNRMDGSVSLAPLPHYPFPVDLSGVPCYGIPNLVRLNYGHLPRWIPLLEALGRTRFRQFEHLLYHFPNFCLVIPFGPIDDNPPLAYANGFDILSPTQMVNLPPWALPVNENNWNSLSDARSQQLVDILVMYAQTLQLSSLIVPEFFASFPPFQPPTGPDDIDRVALADDMLLPPSSLQLFTTGPAPFGFLQRLRSRDVVLQSSQGFERRPRTDSDGDTVSTDGTLDDDPEIPYKARFRRP
jgi:hypothetical protein